MVTEFKCRKCGCKEYRRVKFKIKGKGMSDYHRKLSKQSPVSFNRNYTSKVVCKKCSHSQRFKVK